MSRNSKTQDDISFHSAELNIVSNNNYGALIESDLETTAKTIISTGSSYSSSEHHYATTLSNQLTLRSGNMYPKAQSAFYDNERGSFIMTDDSSYHGNSNNNRSNSINNNSSPANSSQIISPSSSPSYEPQNHNYGSNINNSYISITNGDNNAAVSSRCNVLFIEERYSSTLTISNYFFQRQSNQFWPLLIQSGMLYLEDNSVLSSDTIDEILHQNGIVTLSSRCLNVNLSPDQRDKMLNRFIQKINTIVQQDRPRIVCFLSARLYIAYNRIFSQKHQQEEEEEEGKTRDGNMVFTPTTNTTVKNLKGLQNDIVGNDSFLFVLPIQRSRLDTKTVMEMMFKMKATLEGRLLTELSYDQLQQPTMSRAEHIAVYCLGEFQKWLGPTASLEDAKHVIMNGGSKVDEALLYLIGGCDNTNHSH